MNNFDHPIFKAVTKLMDAAAETGEDVDLQVFVDGGRGDLYFLAPNGHRVCVSADSVTYCAGTWDTGERTEVV